MFLFRKAVLQDFPNVYALKQAVIQNPYPGMSWSETYPSQEILKNDIETGRLFFSKNRTINRSRFY